MSDEINTGNKFAKLGNSEDYLLLFIVRTNLEVRSMVVSGIIPCRFSCSKIIFA